MATRNGERYIRQQIDSILPQLSPGDELVISDDASTDSTLEIIESYHDKRIQIIVNTNVSGITKNFQRALMQSKGEFIFLADQDDVWKLNKIEVMTDALQSADLVICDCTIATDHRVVFPSFFAVNRSGQGLVRNLFRNSYMGCCMAFRRTVLDRALPFPDYIPIHDFWIGLTAELYFRVKFIEERLVHHRHHANNASTTGRRSKASWFERLGYRFRIVKGLMIE